MTTTTSTPTDGLLLAEYAVTGSPEAFEELVRRHGGLVAGVCRRIAPRDAEDVAQAVFLTLAHKAKSLQGLSSVAGWLHHVARDLARNALKSAMRQKVREREARLMRPGKLREDAGWEEIRPILDRELDGLPEKYRVPLLLHYIEGRTQEDIAQEMGCRAGTISTWLHRGRELLRGRMARAGVAVSGGVLFTLILQNSASAAISAGAMSAAVHAAGLVAAGKATAAAGALTPKAAMLVKGGLKAMAIAKLKLAASIVFSIGMAGTGAGVAAYQALHVSAPEGSKADLTPQSFARIHALIRPNDSEWRHLRVNWITDVVAARKKAAAEDKPLVFLYTGGAGYNEPLGVC
jgi:RNA polymerase sigma-70 factor (ECF subfamily)